MAEHLPGMREALGSIPCPTKEKNVQTGTHPSPIPWSEESVLSDPFHDEALAL